MTQLTNIARRQHRDDLLVLYTREMTAVLMHVLLAGFVIPLDP